MKKKLVVLQCMTDAAHPVNVLHHALALFTRHVVELGAISAVRFCGLARHVGLGNELVRTEARRGNGGDSDAALKVEDVALLGMTETSHLNQHLLGSRSCLGTSDVSQEDDEFVSAEAGDKIIVAHGRTQLLRGQSEQLV